VPPRLTSEQARVLRWGKGRRAELPWRSTRDPWAILVSEVMLQQTQVPRVVPRYHEFLDAYPTPADCAAATLDAVLSRWQGLGYPRRARHLWLAARACVERHAGRLPDSLDDLLALPGVGPYTARAVLAFAYERDTGVADTNIARVLARRGGRRLSPSELQREADELVPRGRSWAWNQAVMDVGAQRCRPRDPGCGDCPFASSCAWRGAGSPEPDPALGSAGVSRRQARYEGSDRQARGRLLAALADGPVAVTDAAVASGLGSDVERASAVVASLLGDGLVTVVGDLVHLGEKSVTSAPQRGIGRPMLNVRHRDEEPWGAEA
jgi:A/G-specific adenine glycosylase